MTAEHDPGRREPDLSVIVTSYGSTPGLERCLVALVDQSAAEIVVADCSPADPSAAILARFPSVRVMHVATPRTVPELRWAALALTRSRIVAAVESRCVPDPGWCAELTRMHDAHPGAPAIGGPVRPEDDPSPFEWGLYFCEYGMFAPPMPIGVVPQLSGANLSYKRADLEAHRDLLDAGAWEASIHERWRRNGRSLWMSSAAIVFQNGLSTGDAFRMRFHYGRSYAAGRFGEATLPMWRRAVYAAGAPLLPLVITWRIARTVRRRGFAAPLRRALPWVVALNTAWAAGECAGYLFGKPARPRIF